MLVASPEVAARALPVALELNWSPLTGYIVGIRDSQRPKIIGRCAVVGTDTRVGGHCRPGRLTVPTGQIERNPVSIEQPSIIGGHVGHRMPWQIPNVFARLYVVAGLGKQPPLIIRQRLCDHSNTGHCDSSAM